MSSPFVTFFRIVILSVLALIAVYCIHQMYADWRRRKMRNRQKRRRNKP